MLEARPHARLTCGVCDALFPEGGHRLNDHLRFRGTPYNVPFKGEAGSFDPNGVDRTGLPYGSTTCFPLPIVERVTNPNIP